ncbi:hypothetical protein [Halobacillus mangrovi]|uniref:hypothetical protein n=1 Tax=Halobacillus mangrovi TaxID=402384 RepID=UPI003D954C84
MADIKVYHCWRNDPEVMRYTSPHLDSYTLEENEEFAQSMITSSTSKTYII